MLWYYGRDLQNEPELLAGLQEKVCLAQESSGWEFAVIGLLDVNVYVRLATVGLELSILPRGETLCAHTVTQPPGSVFLLPSLQEDWRFRDNPYVEHGGLKAYAGVPLRMQHDSGECVGLGSLCVASATSQPPLSQQQQQTLTRLADWIVGDIVQCTRVRRQRERRRLAELIESLESGGAKEDSHDSVLEILQRAYPHEVIRIQPSDPERCDVNEPEAVVLPGLKNGIWEDIDYIDDVIATSNHSTTPTDKIVRLLSSQCDTELGHSLLVVGTKDFRRIFDDIDAWFIQTCANLVTKRWQKRLLTEAIRAKEKFLRGISHQLRTPLHGILGAVELLSEELKALSLSQAVVATPALAELAQSSDVLVKTAIYLETISGAGRELMSTVNSMISLNRWADIALAERRHAMHDVGELEEELFKLASEAAHGAGSNASVFYSSHLASGVRLRTDLNLMRDSIWPLVNNAIQNTPKGIVTVMFSMRPGTETFMVDVEDTGCGIPEHDQERVFQLYEKVDEHSTGSGLGLTISTKFAALLHGCVELVSSQVNEGTHFRATFNDVLQTDAAGPTALTKESFQSLPFKYSLLGSDISSHLTPTFAKFLSYAGFAAADNTGEDCFAIFDYSCDPEQYQDSIASMHSKQIAICLVPYSVDQESLESFPRVVYARAPFSTVKLFDALQAADKLHAELRNSSQEAHPSKSLLEKPKPLGARHSYSSIDEGYNSKGTSPQPLSEDESHAAQIGKRSSGNSCSSPTGSTLPSALTTLPPERSAAPMVLVVDDNLVNLRILQMYCKKRGLPFLSAADGKQAVALFSKHQSSASACGGSAIELVLMDLQMPVCDGLDATKQIRALEADNDWPASVLFMVTGQDSQVDREAASAVGADDYMVKPVGMRTLDVELKRYFPLFKAQPAK